MLDELLFPELGGFVIFDVASIRETARNHSTTNMLELFQDELIGYEVVSKGITVPISGLSPDDYAISIVYNAQHSQIVGNPVKKSDGWIIKSTGLVGVCGLGYFHDFDLQAIMLKDKAILKEVPPGVHMLTLLAGYTMDSHPCIEFLIVPTYGVTAIFTASLDTDFDF